jgi:hypothetical protein
VKAGVRTDPEKTVVFMNEMLKKYNLGSKSNISRLQDTLIKKELIEKVGRTVTIADPVFRMWMLRGNTP